MSMRSSTIDHPDQLKLDWEGSLPEASNTHPPDEDIDLLKVRSVPRGAREQSLRNAARINAASTSDEEYQRLLKERARLVQQKFSGELSLEGAARLEYVRWSLDRIEDAKHGYVLDRIEDAVIRYREALQDLQGLRANLAAHLPKGRK